jgi:hypothetical protein
LVLAVILNEVKDPAVGEWITPSTFGDPITLHGIPSLRSG